MAKIRIELNRDGVRQLLQSPEVLGDLKRRAQRIAVVAGPGFEVRAGNGPNRARASVGTTDHASRRAEAENRALTRAIDAGR